MRRDLLRDALRSLRRDRRFTAVAAILLAITIGAVTAVYAIVHAVVLRPFPFADQDRLVVIWQRDDRRALPIVEVAYGEMVDWRARSRSFDDLAVVGSVNWTLTLEGRTEAEPVPIAAVSASFFPVVGTSPFVGRALRPDDDEGQVPRAVVISHGLWMRRFGGDRGIVGRSVAVKIDQDGPSLPMEIAGVMPREFDYPRGAEMWVPAAPLVRKYASAEADLENAIRFLRVFYVVGRLNGTTSLDAAAREITLVMRSADVPAGGAEPNSALVVTPLARYLLGPAEPVLWTLLGGAALMLLIACANVAALQVSRSARRHRAFAIRVALGASHRHLIAQSLLESALLTGAALAGAAIVAFAIARILVILAPAGVPRVDGVTLVDGRVLLVGAAAAFVSVGLCGLWPALVARRMNAVSVLAHGAGAAADPRGRRIQRIVVTVQVAVALTLLAGSALFLRTLHGLNRTTLGFNPDRLLAISVTPPTDDLARWNAFYEAMIARVEALPGVVAAGAVSLRPLSGPIGFDSGPLLPGQNPDLPSTFGLNPHMNLEIVSPGYFGAMGIRLVRGRLFTQADTTASPGVVVVSERAARRLWPGREALGQQLRDGTYRTNGKGAPTGWQTVIGIVEDVRYRGLNDVRLDLYLPATQSSNRVQQLMIRTRENPADAVHSVRAVARDVNPNAGVSDATVMTEAVTAESAPWRFLMRVFVSFAALAAALAALGLGVVIALAVETRRRELAIRAALGADAARLRATVLREGLTLLAIGTVFGLLGALGLGRSVAHLLVGVVPYDPWSLGAAACLGAATWLLATWVPARSAGDADPIEALRAE